MLRIIDDTLYADNNTTLRIQRLLCDKCSSKYVRSFRKYGDGEFNKYLASIDSDSNECPVCNNHNYDVKDLKADELEIDRIITNTNNNSTSTQLKYEVYCGNQPSKLWDIKLAIGKVKSSRYNGESYLETSKYAIVCRGCGYKKLIDATDINSINSTVCNSCRLHLANKVNESYNEKMRYLSKDIEKYEKYKIELEAKKEQQKHEEDVSDIKRRESDRISKARRMLKKYNPNLDILDMYEVDGQPKSLLCCDLCGTPKEYDDYIMRTLKKYECVGCKIRDTNINYKGLYHRDITHTTKNGLYVEKQTDNTVTLRCNYCGARYKDKSKVRFLMGKIYCTKGTKRGHCSSIEFSCPHCYRYIELFNKEVNEAAMKDVVCPYCKENIYSAAKNEIISTDKAIEINKSLNLLALKTKKPTEVKNGITYTRDPLYIGDDLKNYYNCRCIEHNQSCILNDDEIEQDPHKYCNNIHNLFVDEESIKDLRLNSELTFNERKERKK